jgi:excisionase family DNA binding protein
MRVMRKPGKGLRVMSIVPLALSPRDAARLLAVSRRTISNLIRSHKLVARKLGKRTLVDVESIEALYAGLPIKSDHAPLVFGRRAKRQLKPRRR